MHRQIETTNNNTRQNIGQQNYEENQDYKKEVIRLVTRAKLNNHNTDNRQQQRQLRLAKKSHFGKPREQIERERKQLHETIARAVKL